MSEETSKFKEEEIKPETEEKRENVNETTPPEDHDKKKKTSWGLWIFSFLILLVAAWIGGKIRFAFYKARPELYGRYFYTYRINFGDKAMIEKEEYSSIRKNTIDPDKKSMLEFREKAEEKKYKVEVFDNEGKEVKTEELVGFLKPFTIPVHMPRGKTNQASLTIDKDFKFIDLFYLFRAYVIMNLSNNKESENVKKSKSYVLKDSREKQNNFPIEEILEKNPEIKKLVEPFYNLLNGINQGTFKLTDNNTKLDSSSDFYKAVAQLVKEAQNKDVSSDDVLNFLRRAGEVISFTPFDLLIYSCASTMFYFLTLDVEIDGIKMNDATRFLHVARMFDKLASKAFTNSYSYEIKKGEIPAYEKFFGKDFSCKYSDGKKEKLYEDIIKNDEDNLKKLLKRIGDLTSSTS